MIREEYFLPYVLENNKLFLDIETTGLSPIDNEIVVISYASWIEEKGNNMVAISSEISINEKVVISSDKFIENGQKVYISNDNI